MHNRILTPHKYVLLILLCMIFYTSYAQVDSSKFLNPFLTPATEYNSKRFGLVLGTEAVLYTGATIALYHYWYKNYPQSAFHFFNDDGEWLQQDKMGHMYTAYFETNLTTAMYRWTGMKKENAYWAGFATASLFQLTIEVFDGFSAEWGFSWGDFAANTFGAGLATGQNFLWDEQRIRLKFSQHFVDYSSYPLEVQDRAAFLYGSSGPEKVIKDYNGLTTWLSVNPSMFMKEDNHFPKWLMFSAGYGADGIFGGYENIWCSNTDIKYENCPDDLLIDYSSIPRTRQYYLSFDVDLTAFKGKSPFWNMVLEIASILKFPAPAIEFNQGGNTKWYWLYF
ncbi:MAG: DUF2279 domain-containing protein [Chitinophagales bacterium]